MSADRVPFWFKVDKERLRRLRTYCAEQTERTTMQQVVEQAFNELVDRIAPPKRRKK